MTNQYDHYHQERVLAVVSGKGGVGKTSTAANVAASAARGGLVTCIIDLDVTDGVTNELGMTDVSDHGAQLVDAVLGQTPLTPVTRPLEGTTTGRLDVVCGGDALTVLAELPDDSRAHLPAQFQATLEALAPDYDLIVLDTPPGASPQLTMALAGAGWLMATVKTDRGSINTLKLLVPQVAEALAVNPGLRWVGVQIFGVAQGASTILRDSQDHLTEALNLARAAMREVAGDRAQAAADVPLIPLTVRHSAATSDTCRALGLTARELADNVPKMRRERFAALRAKKKAPSAPAAAAGVAQDYEALTRVVIERMQQEVTR